MGRRTQTQLPTAQTLLTPQRMTVVHRQLKSIQLKTKQYYDMGAIHLLDLKPGVYVQVQEDTQWKPAKVVEVCEAPRSYIVESDGQQLRCNRRHLIQTREQQKKHHPWFRTRVHFPLATKQEKKEVMESKPIPGLQSPVSMSSPVLLSPASQKRDIQKAFANHQWD